MNRKKGRKKKEKKEEKKEKKEEKKEKNNLFYLFPLSSSLSLSEFLF
jgi:ribosomal protein L12E/L44/L45/RPP1/RPP2